MTNRRNAVQSKFLFDAILADLAAHLTPLSASIVDYTAGRAEVVKDIADYAAGRAEIVKLVTDLGINNTMLTNIKTYLNALRTFLAGDAIINPTVVSIGSTPENVATTAFQFMINGVTEHKAAVSAGTAFTDADTINTGAAAGSYWGAWLIQIAAGGTITTHSVGADQVYANEAAAIAALPAAEAGNVAIGYVTVNATTDGTWTAGTDDLTGGSDCASATFYSAVTDIPVAISDTPSATASAPAAVTASDPAAVTAVDPGALTLLE
jgi:hypothetical protein